MFPGRLIHRSWYSCFILILVWFAGFAVFIGNRGLWNPDEPRYLQVAWEMSASHSYLIPTFNGDVYTQKPPLFFWLVILLSKLVTFETASRWLTALAGLGSLLLTGRMARRIDGDRGGILAPMILASMGLYSWLLTTGNIDILLTFFITASIFFFLRFTDSGRRFYLFLAYLFAGLGMLTKGPVALVIPLFVFAAITFAWRKDKQYLGYSHLWYGSILSFIVVSFWLVPACISGGSEYARTILFTQNVGRAVGSFAHKAPWYKYLVEFPLLSFPWGIWLLLMIPEICREKKIPSCQVFIIWFLVVFIFFSLVSGKRGRYLIPLFPAASIMLSHAILVAEKGLRLVVAAFVTKFILVVSAICVFLFSAWGVFLLRLKKIPALIKFFHNTPETSCVGLFWLAAATIIVMLLSGIACRRMLSGKQLQGGILFSAALLVLFSGIQFVLIPRIDHIKSASYLAKSAMPLLEKGYDVAFVGAKYNEGWNFYLKKKRIPIIPAETFVESPPDRTVVIVKDRYFDDIFPLAQGRCSIHECSPVGNSDFCLVYCP